MTRFCRALVVIALISLSHNAIAGDLRMEGNTVITSKGADGHFYVPVYINGKLITLEIDTAAAEVVLNQNDAVALGVIPAYSSSKTFITGNGLIKMNGIKATMQVGNIVYPNTEVYLNLGWTGKSVMGMSMLSQFSMVAFNKNEIAFKP